MWIQLKDVFQKGLSRALKMGKHYTPKIKRSLKTDSKRMSFLMLHSFYYAYDVFSALN